MSTGTSVMASVAPVRATRQRILAEAVVMTTESGWASVTMARLAERAGVSRQTVYNEVGSKPALAEAMVLDELGRFLAVVTTAFDAHPDDLGMAVRAAVRGVLELARESALLRAVVSATNGGDTELLPPLTTRAQSLLDTAKAVLTDRLAPLATGVDARQLDAAADAIVRIVLSHVMQPSGTPATTADDVAWIALSLLDR